MGAQTQGNAVQQVEHVQLHVVSDIDYWCAKFACSEEDLRSAVRQVGTSSSDVARYLTIDEAGATMNR